MQTLTCECEVDRSQSITHVTSKRLDYIIIGLMVVAIGLFLLQYLRPPVASTAVEAAATVATPEAGSSTTAPSTAAPAQTAAPAPSEKSIAVLPFADMSQAKDQEYFSDGFTEDLTTALSRLLMFAGLSRLGGVQTALLGISELVTSVLVAFVVLGDRLTPAQWVGAAIIVSSAVLVSREKATA